jgi:hypothetical protein
MFMVMQILQKTEGMEDIKFSNNLIKTMENFVNKIVTNES